MFFTVHGESADVRYYYSHTMDGLYVTNEEVYIN